MFRDLYILLLLYIFVTSEAATNEMCGYRNLSLKWLNYLAFISYSKMVDKILVQPITFKQIGHLHWFPASALWIRGSPWPPRGSPGDDFCLIDLAGFILILREKFFLQIHTLLCNCRSISTESIGKIFVILVHWNYLIKL